MMQRWISFSLFISLMFYASLGYSDEDSLLPPRLIVRGEAKIFKPADQLELVLGVVTQDLRSEVALQANNEKMQKLIASLKQLDLEASDFQTGQFYIQPVYRRPPKEHTEDWIPTISHYEVKNTVHIRTQKLNLAANIITVSSLVGANQINQMQFSLKDPQPFRAEAIALATEHALMDAQALANSAHVRLARILSLSLDQAQPHPFVAPRAMMMAAEGGFASETPIEVGQVEIQAAVNVIFQIDSIVAYE